MKYNVILIGECGAGKSSLVQSMTGTKVRAHNDATAGTVKVKDYSTTIQGKQFKIWDTPGLSGGNQGTSTQAEANVKELISKLRRSEGVHLLVFCTLGGRATRVLENFYSTFFQRVCGTTVPAVLVVTHLDDRRDREGWWDRNAAAFERMNMTFRGHACVSDKLKASPKERKGGISCIIS
ncbi:hypothetical protein F5I97DRAFT_680605 [Phlebopus sp. FC_14]|nr:hypothetical protein F5I97DRAFT_680605 [Phlebopus sp. FC_14]